MSAPGIEPVTLWSDSDQGDFAPRDIERFWILERRNLSDQRFSTLVGAAVQERTGSVEDNVLQKSVVLLEGIVVYPCHLARSRTTAAVGVPFCFLRQSSLHHCMWVAANFMPPTIDRIEHYIVTARKCLSGFVFMACGNGVLRRLCSEEMTVEFGNGCTTIKENTKQIEWTVKTGVPTIDYTEKILQCKHNIFQTIINKYLQYDEALKTFLMVPKTRFNLFWNLLLVKRNKTSVDKSYNTTSARKLLGALNFRFIF